MDDDLPEALTQMMAVGTALAARSMRAEELKAEATVRIAAALESIAAATASTASALSSMRSPRASWSWPR